MKYLFLFSLLILCLISMSETKKFKEKQRSIKGKHKETKGIKHKSRKNTLRKYNSKETNRQTCLNTDCMDTAVSYLKLFKDKISNFEKQWSRLKTQNKTGKSKAGKKGIFRSLIRRLVRAGGGNISKLACNGNTNSTGAEKLQNLTNSLLDCEQNIHSACDTSNLPQPDVPKVEGCVSKMTSFKSGVNSCMKKTGSEACSCWTDSSLGQDVNTIKKCDLSKESKSMAKAVSGCRNAFGACRKLEDEIGLSIHACTQDKTSLVSKLKNLKQNKAALSSLTTKLTGLVDGTRSLSKATTVTCTAFQEKISLVLNLIAQNPSSGKISKLILTITVVTVTCTTSELSSLSSLGTSLKKAESSISAEETSVQKTLTTLTGTTASTSNIESASSCEDNCETSVSKSDSESASTITTSSTTATTTTITTTTTTTTTTPKTSTKTSSAQSTAGKFTTTAATIRTSKSEKKTTKSLLTTTTTVHQQKPVNMLTSTSFQLQKPVNMLTETTTQKPVNMIFNTTVQLQKPVNMGASTVQLQKPVNMGASTVQLQKPVNMGASTVQLQKPVNMGETIVQLQKPVNMLQNTTLQLQSPISMVTVGNPVTTKSPPRFGRESVEKLVAKVLKRSKVTFL